MLKLVKPVYSPRVSRAQTGGIYTVSTVVDSTQCNKQFLSSFLLGIYAGFNKLNTQFLVGYFKGWGGRLNTSSTGSIT